MEIEFPTIESDRWFYFSFLLIVFHANHHCKTNNILSSFNIHFDFFNDDFLCCSSLLNSITEKVILLYLLKKKHGLES